MSRSQSTRHSVTEARTSEMRHFALIQLSICAHIGINLDGSISRGLIMAPDPTRSLFPQPRLPDFSLEFIKNSVLGLGETWGMRGRGFATVESQN